MKQPVFQGTCTALVTPFSGGRVDFGVFHRLLDRQLAARTEAVVLCGTTGESAVLSEEEKHEIIADGVRYVNGRMKVIAGTGSNATDHAAALSRFAERAGADGVLVVSPYYNKANQDGLIRHFSVIADAVSIPVILYNVPSRTGLDIPIPVYQALSEHPNVNGVKEASGDLSKIAQMRSELPEDFYIWSGNDDQTVAMMALGAKGLISVLSNLVPEDTARMVRACLSGDFFTAERLQRALMPLIRSLFCEVNPIPVKAALCLSGIDVGPCRLPLGALSGEHARQLAELLKRDG